MIFTNCFLRNQKMSRRLETLSLHYTTDQISLQLLIQILQTAILVILSHLVQKYKLYICITYISELDVKELPELLSEVSESKVAEIFDLWYSEETESRVFDSSFDFAGSNL